MDVLVRAAWDGSGPGLLTLAALAAILVVATAVAAAPSDGSDLVGASRRR
jgi:hypothetical protein